MNNPTRAAGAVNPTIDAPASYTNTPARSPPPGKRATTDAPAPGRPYEYGDATEFTTTSPLKPAATGCPESTTSNDTNDPNSPRPSAEFSVNPKSSNTYGSADTTGTALNRNFEPTTVGDTDDEINTTSNPDSTPTDTALSSTTDTDNPASTNTSRNARSANGGPAEPATNNTRPPTADTDTGTVDVDVVVDVDVDVVVGGCVDVVVGGCVDGVVGGCVGGVVSAGGDVPPPSIAHTTADTTNDSPVAVNDCGVA